MTDDEILNAVAAAAKAERTAQAVDSSLERLASGKLSAPELRALDERASADPDFAAAVALHRPLGASAEERIAAAVLAPEARVGARPARARGRTRVLYLTVPALAAAAAVTLFVGRTRHHDDVPEFALSFATSAQTERALPKSAAGRTEAELHPSSTLDIVVRPADAVKGPLGARAALLRDGVARAWSPPIQISESGAVRITGRAADLLPPGPGRWDVVIAVGRPSSLPEPGDLLRRAIAEDAPPRGYRLVRGRIEMTP